MFCCPCGDRCCEYIPMIDTRKDATISWKVHQYLQEFSFDYNAYKYEFNTIYELINFQTDLI